MNARTNAATLETLQRKARAAHKAYQSRGGVDLLAKMRKAYAAVKAYRVSAIVILVTLAVIALSATGAQAQDEGAHLVRLQDIAVQAPGSAKVPAHVVLEGIVELNRKERDGDRHIRICAGGLCIVAECIPELREVTVECAGARKGSAVWVTGITRYDGKHGWWEVHPVTAIETK